MKMLKKFRRVDDVREFQDVNNNKTPSIPATMLKQHCRMLQNRMLLWHCCRFRQQCRSNVRLCCQKRQQCRTSFCVEISSFRQSRMLLRQSRTLLRHCCWCGPGLSETSDQIADQSVETSTQRTDRASLVSTPLIHNNRFGVLSTTDNENSEGGHFEEQRSVRIKRRRQLSLQQKQQQKQKQRWSWWLSAAETGSRLWRSESQTVRISEYLRMVDSRLFNSIQSPSHCLSKLLLSVKQHFGLRPRGHCYALPICQNYLCKRSFIPRCLFCFL